MKCPNCGSATPRETLVCECGYDYGKRAVLSQASGTPELPRAVPQSTAGATIAAILGGVVFVLFALPVALYLLFMFFVGGIAASMGSQHDLHVGGVVLWIAIVATAGLLLIAGIIFLLSRLYRPQANRKN